MSLRTLALVLLCGLIAAFTLVNWGAFTAPTTLSLVFATVQAPLGLIMLALTGLLAALFLVYIVYQQAVVIVESRRAARDLAVQTQLADKAEASRITELRAFLESEIGRLDASVSRLQEAISSRVEVAQQALAGRATDMENSLSAHLGEVEDKLDRMTAPRG